MRCAAKRLARQPSTIRGDVLQTRCVDWRQRARRYVGIWCPDYARASDSVADRRGYCLKSALKAGVGLCLQKGAFLR